MIIGEEDPVICSDTAKAVFSVLKCKKKFCQLPAVDHGPFGDAQAIDSVVAQIIDWFN